MKKKSYELFGVELSWQLLLQVKQVSMISSIYHDGSYSAGLQNLSLCISSLGYVFTSTSKENLEVQLIIGKKEKKRNELFGNWSLLFLWWLLFMRELFQRRGSYKHSKCENNWFLLESITVSRVNGTVRLI